MRYLKVRLSPVSADEPKRFYSMLPVYQPWKSLAASKCMPTRSMRTFTRSTSTGYLLYTAWAKEEPPSRLRLPNSPKCGGWLNYRLMGWASLKGDGHCRNCDPI